jgi:hypothetical protein
VGKIKFKIMLGAFRYRLSAVGFGKSMAVGNKKHFNTLCLVPVAFNKKLILHDYLSKSLAYFMPTKRLLLSEALTSNNDSLSIIHSYSLW